MYQLIGVLPFVIGCCIGVDWKAIRDDGRPSLNVRQCMYTVTLTLDFHLIQPAETGIVLYMGSNHIVALFIQG